MHWLITNTDENNSFEWYIERNAFDITVDDTPSAVGMAKVEVAVAVLSSALIFIWICVTSPYIAINHTIPQPVVQALLNKIKYISLMEVVPLEVVAVDDCDMIAIEATQEAFKYICN